MRSLYVYLLLLFVLFALPQARTFGAISACSITITSSNQSYNFPGISCNHVDITFGKGISNSGIVCDGQLMNSNSTIVSQGNDSAVYLRNCTLDGPSITIANKTSLYIMGSDNAVFTPSFYGNSSNITVAYYLRVNVFEPFGYNSSDFGNRAAGFSYIFPLMNNTFRLNNSELQMSEFTNSSFGSEFATLEKSVPFGTYNITQSNIAANYSVVNYGRIKGSKVLALPDYTLYKNKVVRYNPYEIDYSFLAYDQLVMFRLNITGNMNLTPIYIQPLFPPFNFAILPNNGTNSTVIRYVVAVPPQDANWNFTAYLYRYSPSEFTVYPVSGGVGQHSVLFKAFSFPGAAASTIENGTKIYFVNYSAQISLGLNSSIMTLQGNIPGRGPLVQDSTTPSFSFGLGFCSFPYNNTLNSGPSVVYRPGDYSMVPRLLPLAAPATPQLVNGTCTTGIIVSGNDININCGNGTISDTVAGIVVKNSTNVNIENCNVVGNGVQVNGSSGISFFNLTLTPSTANNFGVSIKDSQGVNFYGLRVNNGYQNLFSVLSSAGTPFSEAVEVYSISICGEKNISTVRQVAYIYNSTNTCASPLLGFAGSVLGSVVGLAILTVGLITVYSCLFWRHRHAKKHVKGGRRR